LAHDALALEEIDAFYGDSHVLHRVSLHLGEGRLLGLLGRNGAGKSTSLNVTVGLLPPRHGAVSVYGRAVTGDAPEAIAALGVALVPQGRRVFRSLTVRENLAVAGRKPRGDFPMLWTHETIAGLFPRLAERRGQLAGSLSGGEQQMLAIGRALMNRPALLLLDEPSLGLSPILVKEIFTIIKRVNEEQGMSILLVEQNAKVALETAHYGYVLEIGRVVMNDTCERLMNSKDIQEFYLGAKEEGARGERRWKKKKTWR
jgi:branched-chain amino acid transport system ATP-binding protein